MNRVSAWKRRHAIALRLPPLHCGCHSDPWVCDCHASSAEPSDRAIDAYRDAALSLLEVGLPPAPNLKCMRALWRRGGPDQRLAIRISEIWQVAA